MKFLSYIFLVFLSFSSCKRNSFQIKEERIQRSGPHLYLYEVEWKALLPSSLEKKEIEGLLRMELAKYGYHLYPNIHTSQMMPEVLSDINPIDLPKRIKAVAGEFQAQPTQQNGRANSNSLLSFPDEKGFYSIRTLVYAEHSDSYPKLHWQYTIYFTLYDQAGEELSLLQTSWERTESFFLQSAEFPIAQVCKRIHAIFQGENQK